VDRCSFVRCQAHRQADLTPGAQYYWNYGLVDDDDRYEVGLTLDYALAEGLALKADIQYGDNNASADERWDSFVRLQRSF
jgi:hypothetical protein